MTTNRNPLMLNSSSQTTNYYNPQFNTILNNPQAQQLIASLKKQMPNLSPREMAYQLAKQRGLDINPLLSRFGLK
jgi:hypothetical protein